jgi:hypothetical protein
VEDGDANKQQIRSDAQNGRAAMTIHLSLPDELIIGWPPGNDIENFQDSFFPYHRITEKNFGPEFSLEDKKPRSSDIVLLADDKQRTFSYSGC